MPSQLGKCAVDKDILSGIGHVVTNENALCAVQCSKLMVRQIVTRFEPDKNPLFLMTKSMTWGHFIACYMYVSYLIRF